MLDQNLIVEIPTDKGHEVNTMCKGMDINIENQSTTADLVVLKMEKLDTILGMNWLANHNTMVGWFTKFITLKFPNDKENEI